jgi:CRP-like cAMP-binding protein
MSLYSSSPEPSSEALRFLETNLLFDGLRGADLERVAARLNRKNYSAGVTLFHQDMPGLMLYMIAQGHVRVFGVGLTGQEHTLNTFRAGDVFGELSILDGKPRSASAITMTDTSVWLLSKADLDDLIERHTVVARSVIRTLTERVRTAANHVEAIIFQDVLGRLAYELHNLAGKHGSETAIGIRIDMPLTQSDLATIVGATRESVNKSLRVLRDSGLVLLDGAEIIVQNPSALSQIVQERGR